MTKRRGVEAGNLYGSLEMLILKALHQSGPLHGLQIIDQIRDRSRRHFRIEVGALYPALHRLRFQELVEAEWRISEKGRRAKFYDITPTGVAALEEEIESWLRHTKAVAGLLGLSEEFGG